MGNHQSDIALKWELAKYTKKIDEAYALFNNQVQLLIKEKGKKDDKGNISLDVNNEDYLKLYNLGGGAAKKITIEVLLGEDKVIHYAGTYEFIFYH